MYSVTSVCSVYSVYCLLFVRLPSNLPANPRPHITHMFETKLYKHKFPQRQTQCNKYYTNHRLTSRKVFRQFVLWSIDFTMRSLAAMSIITFRYSDGNHWGPLRNHKGPTGLLSSFLCFSPLHPPSAPPCFV